MDTYRCATCGQLHSGIPSFGWHYPLPYLLVPEEERAERTELGTGHCVIRSPDGEEYFVRGCLEVPVGGYEGEQGATATATATATSTATATATATALTGLTG